MRKVVEHTPLGAISLLMIYSIYVISTTDIVFSYEHYIGITGIILSIIFLFIKPVIGKLLTGITLLLGTFTFAAFTAIIEYHRMGFSIEGNGFDIKIQFYCLVLLIIYFVIHFRFIQSLFQKKKTK